MQQGLTGPSFYDDDAIFEAYQTRRGQAENANETLEQPAFMDIAGELRGKRILELGCGDARFARKAINNGCKAYLGVEGSRNMVALAQAKLAGSFGEVIHADLETWTFPQNSFDLVISRLVLHYLSNLEPIFRGTFGALVPGGRFEFSVEHPVITSCERAWQGKGRRQEWIVDDYFVTGARDVHWLGGQVRKYHRTVQDYFSGLQSAGFIVETLSEAAPRRDNFQTDETYLRRMRIPLFLLMAARRDIPVT